MNMEQRNATVVSNLHLVRSAARKTSSFRMGYEERYSIGCKAMIKAVATYLPGRSSFSHYFYHIYQNDLADAIRRDYNPTNTISMDAPLGYKDVDGDLTLHDVVTAACEDALDVVIKRETISELHSVLSKLPTSHRIVIGMRYLTDGGLSQPLVAKKLGRACSWVSRKEQEALRLCRQMMAC